MKSPDVQATLKFLEDITFFCLWMQTSSIEEVRDAGYDLQDMLKKYNLWDVRE